MADLPHLSHSSRTTYLKCGKAYELGKVLKVPQRPSFAQVGGSAVHLATERIDRAALAVDTEETFYGVRLSDLLGGGEAGEGQAPIGWEEGLDLPCLPGDTARTVFEAAWDQCVAEQLERNPEHPYSEWKATGRKSAAWPTGRDDGWWARFGPQMVAAYVGWRLETRWPIPKTPAGVDAVEVEVAADLGYRTKGYVDRVFVLPNGDLCVADLKTGTRDVPDMQLGEYASQLEALFGTRPPWGVFVKFPVRDEAARCVATEPLDLSRWQIGVFERMNAAVAAQIKADVFTPNVTPDCNWCYVAEHCAVMGGAKARGVDPLYEVIHGTDPA